MPDTCLSITRNRHQKKEAPIVTGKRKPYLATAVPFFAPLVLLCAVSGFIALDFNGNRATAQELNQRKHAPPSANAKKARVLTEARSQAAERNDANLNRSTVNTDCSPIEIGNQDLSDGNRLSHDEQVVVVPGDIINICR